MSGPTAAAAPMPKLAVWKFASCDGCQLTVLDCAEELLTLSEKVQIAHFTEASSAEVAGPYDVSLVEGSITTSHDEQRIAEIRAASGILVTIGACATSGGIQALRNFADVAEFTSVVYARPEYVSTLATSTAIADHVVVDFELRGCPIDRRQLLELLSALLTGRRPAIPAHSVCYECKERGNVCVMVAHGTPCLGPVTQAGCGAICPAFSRGCYGCFGPVISTGGMTGSLGATGGIGAARAADIASAAGPGSTDGEAGTQGDESTDGAAATQIRSLTGQLRQLGMTSLELQRVFSTFNAASPAFAAAARDASAAPDASGAREAWGVRDAEAARDAAGA
jgi:sulfhydrogenase subunit delta